MNVSALKSDIDFLCSSTSATYAPTDKLRNMNIAYHDVARVIWESAGNWQYDDTNATTLPFATRNLVVGQADYELPSEAQRIERVEVKDGEGNFILLKQKDLHDIENATSEYYETDGTPLWYDVFGRTIYLYPAPATGYVTTSQGLKVYVSRDVTELDDDADTPGFAVPFHRILSYSASIDFTRSEEDRNHFIREKSRLMEGLQRFYGKRNVEGKTTMKPSGKKRWRQYT